MTKLTPLVLAVAIAFASAAPSELNNQHVSALDPTSPDNEGATIDDIKSNVEQPTTRQKRWYNFQGYPPMNPFVYPSFIREDQSPYTPFSSPDTQIYHLHNRIRDLATQLQLLQARQLALFNVVLVPVNCGCTNNQTKPRPVGNDPMPTEINNRFPELEDSNQNWGLILDTPEDNTDYSRRPLNFEPIVPDTPLTREPPPVEHGSSQAGVNTPTQGSEVPPVPASVRPTEPPTTQGPLAAPTACDSAILACCRILPVTITCFTNQGCPNPTAYGNNPCDKSVIKGVLERFNYFYMRNSIP